MIHSSVAVININYETSHFPLIYCIRLRKKAAHQKLDFASYLADNDIPVKLLKTLISQSFYCMETKIKETGFEFLLQET